MISAALDISARQASPQSLSLLMLKSQPIGSQDKVWTSGMFFVYSIVLLIAVSILALVVWNALAWPVVMAAGRVRPGSVSVLIPARDEERNLARCLDAVLRQGEPLKEILVYDDHSVDGTAEIISRYAKMDDA